MESKYLLDDALWKMAYFSDSDQDEENIGYVKINASPTRPSDTEHASNLPLPVDQTKVEEAEEVESTDSEIDENEPTVDVDFLGRKPPTYEEVTKSMPSEMYLQRTEEMKLYGIHYLDKFDAEFSEGKSFYSVSDLNLLLHLV